MLLAVDIGNTNIVIGVFDKDKLVRTQRMPSDCKFNIKNFRGVDSAVIASVVPGLTSIVAKKIKEKFNIKPIEIKWQNIRNLNIILKNKVQIGIDRLVDSSAAVEMYGAPAIVIDFGTATTFCAIDKKGRYLGGAITSGLAISRDVLHERTAKLPLIKISKPSSVIGGNTVDAMRSGLFWGYVDMVEGLIRRFKAKLGKGTKVVATGGLSPIISTGTKMIDIVDPDLTLKGLNFIYKEMRYARREIR